ncbi:MAG: HTTM domain-containing protein, partial [Myxococcales bacterium]|nr:HTTM domain-containing protein [Myxococcales bacterium]
VSYRSPLELHALGGSAAYEVALFAVAAGFALLLLVGRFTRVATVGCFVLTASLHFRNPFILLGFDHILRVALFWSMFLPLGDTWSLDARRARRAPRSRTHASVASAALLLQVALIYFMAGLAKTGDVWLESFTAIEWVLHDTSWAFDHAQGFLAFPALLRGLTVATLVLEIGAPVLLLSPLFSGPVRTFGVCALLGLQLGIGSLMDLYLFPLVNLVLLVGLLPSFGWERLTALRAELPTPRPSAPPGVRHRLRDAFVVASLLLVVLLNASYVIPSVAVPGPLHWAIHAIGLHQRWELYGPEPRRADKQPTFAALLQNGERVGLDTESESESWRVVRDIEGHYRYRLFTVFSLDRDFEVHEILRPVYAQWICDRWNRAATAERQMNEVRLVAVTRRLRLRREPTEPKIHAYHQHLCRG